MTLKTFKLKNFHILQVNKLTFIIPTSLFSEVTRISKVAVFQPFLFFSKLYFSLECNVNFKTYFFLNRNPKDRPSGLKTRTEE